jgi:protein-L-isoaspartate(D-aspartate) O-methyltransferase
MYAIMAGIDEMRRRMVADLATRGITNQRVLVAMGTVHREGFVAPALSRRAYDDSPLAIGLGQTISQPYIVAAMAAAAEVEPGDRVLEIGTGSGYGAAVLAALGAKVWTIERHPALAAEARRNLAAEGVAGVEVIVGDGTQGLEAEAPFDAIVVTASPEVVPPALTDQLADGAALVIPVGPAGGVQTLLRLRRHGARLEREELGPVRFVPLVSD